MAEEGTVDWTAATEFFTGNTPAGVTEAASEEESAQEEPKLVEVKLKGRTIKLPAEDAAAVEAFRREVRERDGRLGGENAAMKERLARLEGRVEEAARRPVAPPTPITPPDPKLVETDFAAWQRQNDAYHSALRAQDRADLEAKFETDRSEERRQAEEARRNAAWASKFYKAYDHLDSPHLAPIVSSTYARYQEDILGAGDVDAQQERLASLVDEALVDLKAAGKTTTSRKPPTLEGASTPAPTKPPKSDERKPITGADWVAKKRAQLRGEGKK